MTTQDKPKPVTQNLLTALLFMWHHKEMTGSWPDNHAMQFSIPDDPLRRLSSAGSRRDQIRKTGAIEYSRFHNVKLTELGQTLIDRNRNRNRLAWPYLRALAEGNSPEDAGRIADPLRYAGAKQGQLDFDKPAKAAPATNGQSADALPSLLEALETYAAQLGDPVLTGLIAAVKIQM